MHCCPRMNVGSSVERDGAGHPVYGEGRDRRLVGPTLLCSRCCAVLDSDDEWLCRFIELTKEKFAMANASTCVKVQVGRGVRGWRDGWPVQHTMTAPRIVTSYAPDSPAHEDAVRHLGGLLDGCGMDARLDEPAAERRLDWPLWMLQQVRDADTSWWSYRPHTGGGLRRMRRPMSAGVCS